MKPYSGNMIAELQTMVDTVENANRKREFEQILNCLQVDDQETEIEHERRLR